MVPPNFFFAPKGVRRGAQSDDRFSRVHEFGEMNRLSLGRIAEAGSDDHEVGVLQLDQAEQSLLVVGVDVVSLRVPGKDDHAIESVMLAEDFAEHRHDLFGSIFLVARHQDDLLSFAGTVLPRQFQNLTRMVIRQGRGGENRGQKNENVFHGQSIGKS